jgi:hypothetical protein
MTLEQALNSGKKFRRPRFKPYKKKTVWLTKAYDETIIFDDTNAPWAPRLQDLVADDWIIEEEKRMLSLDEILKAVEDASTHCNTDFTEFKYQLGKTLGYDVSMLAMPKSPWGAEPFESKDPFFW